MYRVRLTESYFPAQTDDVILDTTVGSILRDRAALSPDAEALVETALKIAKQVQVLRGFPKRYKVIARRGSYHGMTAGALGLRWQNYPTMQDARARFAAA